MKKGFGGFVYVFCFILMFFSVEKTAWAGSTYSVWGGNVLFFSGHPSNYGYSLLGTSTTTQTFSGSYPYYCIYVDPGNIAFVDAVKGSDGKYAERDFRGSWSFPISTTISPWNVFGPPDDRVTAVGGVGRGANGGFILFDFSSRNLTGITVYIGTSKPIRKISGTISYSGSQTGWIRVLCYDNPQMYAFYYGAHKDKRWASSNGYYEIWVIGDGSFYIYANMDVDGNDDYSADEPIGWYGYPEFPKEIVVNGSDVTNINFTIKDSIYVDCSYTGSIENGTRNSPFKTIQAAIDYAQSGQVVNVAPGTYNENLFINKNIFLNSVKGPLETIINGASPSQPCVATIDIIYATCGIKGFTIIGMPEPYEPDWFAHGVSCSESKVVIFECVIKGSRDAGIEIYSTDSSYEVLIANTLITNNRIGVYPFLQINTVPTLLNTTVAFNSYGICGNVPNLTNNIITNNTIGISILPFGNLVGNISYNNVWGNGINYEGVPDQTGKNGNISQDPLFLDPNNGDFRLRDGSPCIDAGDPTSLSTNEPAPHHTRIDMGVFGNTPYAGPWSLSEAGPIAYWRFEEGSGNTASDSSGNGNNGTLQGGVNWTSQVAPKDGGNWALEFNGSSGKIEIPHQSIQVGMSSLTIEAWVKPTGLPNSQNTIVKKWGWGGTEDAYCLRIDNDGRVVFTVHDGSQGESVWSNISIPLNQWTHIAGVWDGSTVKIYLNGELNNSAPAQIGPIGNCTYPLTIGGPYYSWLSEWFKGIIDEVKIYNYVRTDAQIAEDAGTIQPEPSLTVTPTEGLSSSGVQGGPFSPSSKAYTLSNTGGSPLIWTASKNQNWITLSKTNGTLNPGASDTVTVSIDNASGLPPGNYSDTITFVNTTNHQGDTTRSVSLTITSSSQITLTLPNVTCRAGRSFQESVNTTDLTGQGIISIDLTITYNSSILECIAVEKGTVTSGSDWILTSNIDNSLGKVIVSLYGTSSLSGAGSLAIITFNVKAMAQVGQTSPFRFSQALLNEGNVSCTTQDGIFTVAPNWTYGDVSGNGSISSYDAALVAQLVVGIITEFPGFPGIPVAPGNDPFQCADVSGNGTISSYDAALIAQKVVGIIDHFPVEK